MDRENLHFELAVVVSLLLHALTVGCWENRDSIARFTLFKPIAALAHVLVPQSYQARAASAEQTITFVEAPAPKPAPEPPKEFMETDASQSTGEQPKNARYYSDKASVAANADNPSSKNGETPYLQGKQSRTMSTETVAPNLGPGSTPVAPPAPPPSASVKAQVKPTATAKSEQPKEVPLEGLNLVEEKKLAMVSPEETVPSPPSPVRPPPSQAAGNPSDRDLAALKSHLAVSGVTKIGIDAFNVESSPLGAYDKQLIKAVQSRWYALINKNGLDSDGEGTVIVQFQLLQDGTVQGVKTKETSAGVVLSLFCESAIQQAAPFEPVPDNLRILVGDRPREIEFTFHYY